MGFYRIWGANVKFCDFTRIYQNYQKVFKALQSTRNITLSKNPGWYAEYGSMSAKETRSGGGGASHGLSVLILLNVSYYFLLELLEFLVKCSVRRPGDPPWSQIPSSTLAQCPYQHFLVFGELPCYWCQPYSTNLAHTKITRILVKFWNGEPFSQIRIFHQNPHNKVLILYMEVTKMDFETICRSRFL